MLALVWLGLGCFSYVVAEEVWLAYVLGAPDQGCPRSMVPQINGAPDQGCPRSRVPQIKGAPDQGCPRSRVLYRGKEYVMLDLKSDFWRLHKFFTSS